jgi:hypothetical protein
MRRVRGGVLPASTVVLAVIAHLLGGGSAPAIPALALAALVFTAFAVAASDRQWSPLRALLVVVGAEAGLHAWFCLTTSGPGIDHAAFPGGPLMLAAPAPAAAAVALLLAGGDGAIWQLLTLLVGRVGGAVRHLVGAGLVPLAAPGDATGPMPAAAVLAAASWLGSGSVRRRGPPARRRGPPARRRA